MIALNLNNTIRRLLHRTQMTGNSYRVTLVRILNARRLVVPIIMRVTLFISARRLLHRVIHSRAENASARRVSHTYPLGVNHASLRSNMVRHSHHHFSHTRITFRRLPRSAFSTIVRKSILRNGIFLIARRHRLNGRFTLRLLMTHGARTLTGTRGTQKQKRHNVNGATSKRPSRLIQADTCVYSSVTFHQTHTRLALTGPRGRSIYRLGRLH